MGLVLRLEKAGLTTLAGTTQRFAPPADAGDAA